MFNRDSRTPGRVDMLISASAKVHGDVEFAGGLHIEGHVFGAVRAYGDGESTVSVGDSGVIDRGVVATHVVVNGIIRGDIQATGKVALGPNAQVLGNVRYGTIESAAGAKISGKLLQVRPTAHKVAHKGAPKATEKAAKG
jgi:cytoskeletal protein CcmA (bactofilin family)